VKDTLLKVAVIGCGRISGHHCRSIAATPGVELLAVCDLVEQKAADYSKEFGVPYFLNYHEMFAALPDINIVAIMTPSGMHHEHATEILNLYRKNVIVEKPTFMRPSQLRDAYATADRLGLHLFPVFQNRYNRAVRRVRQALKDGELGKVRIIAVRVRWCRPQRYYELAEWRGTYSQDGGALTNQGIHHVDLLRVLGGEVVRVNATMRTLGADIEVEDSVVGSMTYADDSIGVLEVTTAARPDNYEASISLVCEKGLAQIGGIAVNELQIFTPDPLACAEWSEDFSGNVYGKGHSFIYQEIYDFFEKGNPYPVDRQDCLNTIKLLHAFYRSDEAGQWVDVDTDAESVRLGRPDETLADLYRTPRVVGQQA
jgi:UDP-N-acetyl-2-amino-2-deoxyglucuronate dehydrogenase